LIVFVSQTFIPTTASSTHFIKSQDPTTNSNGTEFSLVSNKLQSEKLAV
jgi:hypothetical protein